MSTRVFKVSPSYRRRQQARQLAWLLAMLGLVALSLYYLVQSLSGPVEVAELLLPVLGVLSCSAYAAKLVMQLRVGKRAYPDVCWDMEQEVLQLQQPEGTVRMALADMLSARVQVGLGRVLSLTLTSTTGEQLRLEGYKGLDELVDLLENRMPEGQVVRTRLRF
ncbi:hypothetical protein H9C73_03255 [Marinobacterium sp. AK62]|uniref:DUF304 domain-containing protein n=1 Tax=Marinobacterium alkalitolerans TaxID=1542925 RepID=A0ABS3Z7Q3_9GAMM|nr:hypothetical protein [Marinobacterium alkalitolerans]MBP0047741.1 hypothetical protein [Marinobacterium alkalitolerans]